MTTSDNACMTPGELLQALLNKRQMSANQLAERLGGGGLQSAMSRLMAGKTPRAETLRPIAEFFEIDPAVFQTVSAATECAIRLGLERGFADAPTYVGTANKARRKVPVIGTAKMGDDGFYEEFSAIQGAGDGSIDIYTDDPDAFCLRMKGMSMFPAIRDGWYVLIEPNSTPAEGEYVLLKLKSGAKMVKEFLYRRSGTIELMSVNGGERMSVELQEIEDFQAVAAVIPPSRWSPM